MSSYDEHLISMAGGDGEPKSSTFEEWQFLNADGCWIDGNRNFPEVSARDNAAYFKTGRVRTRTVTRTEWIEP